MLVRQVMNKHAGLGVGPFVVSQKVLFGSVQQGIQWDQGVGIGISVVEIRAIVMRPGHNKIARGIKPAALEIHRETLFEPGKFFRSREGCVKKIMTYFVLQRAKVRYLVWDDEPPRYVEVAGSQVARPRNEDRRTIFYDLLKFLWPLGIVRLNNVASGTRKVLSEEFEHLIQMDSVVSRKLRADVRIYPGSVCLVHVWIILCDRNKPIGGFGKLVHSHGNRGGCRRGSESRPWGWHGSGRRCGRWSGRGCGRRRYGRSSSGRGLRCRRGRRSHRCRNWHGRERRYRGCGGCCRRNGRRCGRGARKNLGRRRGAGLIGTPG